MEGETDFDPTTEEGQADINDDDYDALFTEDESPRRFFDRMVDRFGGAWRVTCLLLDECGDLATPTGRPRPRT